MNIQKWLVNIWKGSCCNYRGEKVDIIVPVSYTTKPDMLTMATSVNAMRASRVASLNPNTVILYSNCTYVFEGAENVENVLKKRILKDAQVKCHRVDNMRNSVEEAQAIQKYVDKHNINAKRILIITGEMHSRSAKYIWERVFPKSKIFISCIDYSYEYELNHRVIIQRTWIGWAFANVARQILLHLMGLRIGRWNHTVN